jgi:hypothetical protein
MRRLQKRVARAGSNHKQAMASYSPAQTTGGGVTGGDASPTGADVMPLAAITVYPEPGGGYSTLGYQGLVPIFTADGAAIPSTSPGRWAQLRMAGRP